MNVVKEVVQDILSFFRHHRPHFIIAAPMAIVITVILYDEAAVTNRLSGLDK